MYSQYYQAHAVKDTLWFVIGTFRNEEHVAFVRTLDSKKNIIEFFVPPLCEEAFVHVISHLHKLGYITSFEKMENRAIGRTSL